MIKTIYFSHPELGIALRKASDWLEQNNDVVEMDVIVSEIEGEFTKLREWLVRIYYYEGDL